MDSLRSKSGGHFGEQGTGNKLSAIELSIQKLKTGIFELEFLEAVTLEITEKLRVKERKVKEEMRKMDDQHYERWEEMSEFCEKVWNFSEKHNLISILNQYLDMPPLVPQEIVPVDVNQQPEVLEAKNQLKELYNQLRIKKSENQALKEKVMQSRIQLRVIKSYRDTDAEIIRLKYKISENEEEYFDLESKIIAEELTLENWQQYETPPVAETKPTFVTASELMAENEKKDSIEKSKFRVKKESAISRGLTATRLAGLQSRHRENKRLLVCEETTSTPPASKMKFISGPATELRAENEREDSIDRSKFRVKTKSAISQRLASSRLSSRRRD